jgi:hypothetical protein
MCKYWYALLFGMSLYATQGYGAAVAAQPQLPRPTTPDKLRAPQQHELCLENIRLCREIAADPTESLDARFLAARLALEGLRLLTSSSSQAPQQPANS